MKLSFPKQKCWIEISVSQRPLPLPAPLPTANGTNRNKKTHIRRTSVAILAEMASNADTKRARCNGTDQEHAELLEEFVVKQGYIGYSEDKDSPLRSGLIVAQKRIMQKLYKKQKKLEFQETLVDTGTQDSSRNEGGKS